MPASKQYAQFIALLEMIESVALRQAAESITLRAQGGRAVGLLTVDGGQVRFGVEHQGKLFIDESFMREQPRMNLVLRKILERQSLARAERDLTWDISALARVSLCSLTARALRRLSVDCVLPTGQGRSSDIGLPQLRLLNVSFSPVELALAAGQWGAVRYEDPAAQLYWLPPVPTEERWLFEWQPNDGGAPWPVLTDRVAERRMSSLRLYGVLGQLLVSQGITRRARAERASLSAMLMRLDEGLCYLVSSSRYATLLIYDRTHITRLITALEELVEVTAVRRNDTSPDILLAGKVALAAGQRAASSMLSRRTSRPPLPIPSPAPAGDRAPQTPTTPAAGVAAGNVAPVAESAPGQSAIPPVELAPPAPAPAVSGTGDAAWQTAVAKLIESPPWHTPVPAIAQTEGAVARGSRPPSAAGLQSSEAAMDPASAATPAVGQQPLDSPIGAIAALAVGGTSEVGLVSTENDRLPLSAPVSESAAVSELVPAVKPDLDSDSVSESQPVVEPPPTPESAPAAENTPVSDLAPLPASEPNTAIPGDSLPAPAFGEVPVAGSAAVSDAPAAAEWAPAATTADEELAQQADRTLQELLELQATQAQPAGGEVAGPLPSSDAEPGLRDVRPSGGDAEDEIDAALAHITLDAGAGWRLDRRLATELGEDGGDAGSQPSVAAPAHETAGSELAPFGQVTVPAPIAASGNPGLDEHEVAALERAYRAVEMRVGSHAPRAPRQPDPLPDDRAPSGDAPIAADGTDVSIADRTDPAPTAGEEVPTPERAAESTSDALHHAVEASPPFAAASVSRPYEPIVPAVAAQPIVEAAREPAHAILPSVIAGPPVDREPRSPHRTRAVLLQIERLTLRREGRTILKEVSFQLGHRGVYCMMGPGGSGKSTLLGLISGSLILTDAERTGTIWYAGHATGNGDSPALIAQHPHFPMQSIRDYLQGQEIVASAAGTAGTADDEPLADVLHRVQLPELWTELDRPLAAVLSTLTRGARWRLAIARELLREPALLCIDEPTFGLDDLDAALILDVIKQEGLRRTVLWVTHNQQHAHVTSHHVLLLAAGQLQEFAPAERFFAAPVTRAAQDFVRTGGCSVPSPEAPAEQLTEEDSTADATGREASSSSSVAGVSRPVDAAALDAAPAPTAVTNPRGTGDGVVVDERRGEREVVERPLRVDTGPSQDLQSQPPAPRPPHASEEAGGSEPNGPAADDVLWRGVGGPAVLTLRDVALHVGERVILQGVSLDIAARGTFLLRMLNGGEKRLFVRALCGPRPANFRITGVAMYQGRPLQDDNVPATPYRAAQDLMTTVAEYLGNPLVRHGKCERQDQRIAVTQLLERAGFPNLQAELDQMVINTDATTRRVLENLRAAVPEPALLVLDEPLAGVPLGERHHILRLLAQQAKQRALLLLADDVSLAEPLAAAVGWLSEGRIFREPPKEASVAPVASGPGAVMASSPKREEAWSEHSAQQGTVSAPSQARSGSTPHPAAADSTDTPSPAPEPYQQVRRAGGGGPRGFQWLRPGALAGMPAPGLTNDLEYDLDLIRHAGVTYLVTLTHELVPAQALQRHDLTGIHFPITDMDVPAAEQAALLCQQISGLLARGHAVGLHCKAGLGRTGTMLACQLIWEGLTAAASLSQVRSVEAGWIQSDKQVKFLGQFETWLRDAWPLEAGVRKAKERTSSDRPSAPPAIQTGSAKDSRRDGT